MLDPLGPGCSYCNQTGAAQPNEWAIDPFRRLIPGRHFSPGRAVELGDVVANGAGVSCGALLGLPIRACIAIL